MPRNLIEREIYFLKCEIKIYENIVRNHYILQPNINNTIDYKKWVTTLKVYGNTIFKLYNYLFNLLEESNCDNELLI